MFYLVECEPMVSIILPTYNEAENLKIIIPLIFDVLATNDLKGEVIVVDDNSPDGTAEVASSMKKDYPLQVHVRKNERGLSTAVMKGFELSKGSICVVMDADLSHPVKKLPEMIKPIYQGETELTIGSRYIEGGCAENWPFLRKFISIGAGLLSKGVVNLSDPTSGFMAFNKSILKNVKLDPVGWKIVLEVIVKADPHFIEIPIIFRDRIKGESKLNLKAQFEYLHHLCRLYSFKLKKNIKYLVN